MQNPFGNTLISTGLSIYRELYQLINTIELTEVSYDLTGIRTIYRKDTIVNILTLVKYFLSIQLIIKYKDN